MRARKDNSPYILRSKEICKKFRETTGSFTTKIALINPGIDLRNQPKVSSHNEEEIQHSTSFKSNNKSQKFQIGATSYGKKGFNDPLQKAKSVSKKKNAMTMHKTITNWKNINRQNEYGELIENDEQNYKYRINEKNRNRINNRKNSIKSKVKFPSIINNEDTKFVPNPVAEKSDKYIRYIIEKKKLENDNRNNSNERPAKLNMKNCSNETGIRTMKMDGINFEVHTNKKPFPKESLESLKEGEFHQMNLMYYDFNGSGHLFRPGVWYFSALCVMLVSLWLSFLLLN